MASQEEKVAAGTDKEPSDDNAEFSGAWDSFEAEESGQAAPAADHQGEASQGADQEGDEAGQGEAQAGQPAASTPPGADTGQVSREGLSDDVLASADPAVRAYVEQLRDERQKAQNLARINGGRLAKALNELAAAKEAQAELSEEEKAKRSKVREDYEEVADTLLTPVERLESEVGKLRAAEVARAEAEVADALAAEHDALLARHPDVPTIVADPAYAEWVKAQTPAIQRIVQENSQAVVNADDAALVFDLFKQSRGMGNTAAAEAARAAEARRKAQLDAGRTATGRTPSPSSNAPTEAKGYGDAWDEFEQQDKRRAAASRR